MAKAIISTTYDDMYLWNLPLVAWCWNKIGVGVICFLPELKIEAIDNVKLSLISEVCSRQNCSPLWWQFSCPKHKEATYAQCARLYGACLDLTEDEILITGDVDMANFKLPYKDDGNFTIVGLDLVPTGQVPMCYLGGTVKQWRLLFNVGNKNYQQCLDEVVGVIECEHFRGNQWSLDQFTAHTKINEYQKGNIFDIRYMPRARPGTQFADHRVDRDDINWRAYVNDDLIDAHLWRPGYTDENFANILELMQMKYPNENFQWLIDYTNEYKKMI